MRTPLDSSFFVRWMRRATEGSVLCVTLAKVATPPVRILQRLFVLFPARAVPGREALDSRRVASLFRDNRLVGAGRRGLDAVVRAWRESRALRVVTPMAHDAADLEPWQRVRLIGWMIVVATSVHAVTSPLGGEALAWTSFAAWSVALTAGVGLMVACRDVAAGWTTWRSRKF